MSIASYPHSLFISIPDNESGICMANLFMRLIEIMSDFQIPYMYLPFSADYLHQLRINIIKIRGDQKFLNTAKYINTYPGLYFGNVGGNMQMHC